MFNDDKWKERHTHRLLLQNLQLTCRPGKQSGHYKTEIVRLMGVDLHYYTSEWVIKFTEFVRQQTSRSMQSI